MTIIIMVHELERTGEKIEFTKLSVGKKRRQNYFSN
jgi:hypothetical protein